MDVLLVHSSVFDLPSSQRVGAIVYDGAADLRLWPGPGTDRDLLEAYGPDLKKVLDTQRGMVEGGVLPLGSVVWLHPGRLHCDMLLWIATRPPEPGVSRQPPPDAAGIRDAVEKALDFVAPRHVLRVAFPALGAGPGEVDRAERLVTIVEAAHAWSERRFASRQAIGVEDVLVCEPLGAVLSAVRKRVANLARTAAMPAPAPAEEREPRRRAPSAPRASGGGASRARGPVKRRLDPDEVARVRPFAEKYDMKRTYAGGDWFVHPKFGIGRVEQVTPEGAVSVLFEDGEQRKMVHGRS